MKTEALVERVLEGDVDSFTELVTRYERMTFAYALTMLGDYQLAEDATQQALMTAYRNLASLRNRPRFGGWLRGIVRFECLRLLRDRSSNRVESLNAPGVVEPVDYAMSVEGQAEIRGELQALIAQMESLPPKQRVAAQLYYFGDHSQVQVAEFLGLSVSTVNNRLREARVSLRSQGVYPMRKQPIHTPSFANKIGTVVCFDGQIVDAVLEPKSRPPLLTAVEVGEKDRALTAFVSQYLDDDVARLVVLDESGGNGETVKGTPVHSQGKVTDIRVTEKMLDGLIEDRHSNDGPALIATGIKVIDLFSPIVRGGTVALIGASNVGKLVLVEELAARLADSDSQITILVFLTSPDETTAVHELDARIDGPITTMYVPVADASFPSLSSSLDRVDTVIVFSGELASSGHYPAIDPLMSKSNPVLPSVSASRARKMFQEDPESERARLLRAYLSQPFFVAEKYTGLPGIAVNPDQAEVDLQRILTGDIDGLVPEYAMMRGSLRNSQ